jgi:hypothetical protein
MTDDARRVIRCKPKYSLQELLAECETSADPFPILKDWDEMVALGKEIPDADAPSQQSA